MVLYYQIKLSKSGQTLAFGYESLAEASEAYLALKDCGLYDFGTLQEIHADGNRVLYGKFQYKFENHGVMLNDWWLEK